MFRYILISLTAHLLILFFCRSVLFANGLSNFSHGSNNAGITVGLGVWGENTSGYESIGVEELSAYADPQNRPPIYPPQALLRRWQGESVLFLRINKSGQVENSILEISSGYEILDGAALTAARQWQFPGLNRPVEVRFPVRFVLG